MLPVESGGRLLVSWIGLGIGALLGSQRGGLLGGIVGAVLGNWLEAKAKEFVKGKAGDGTSGSASANELSTLAALAAMLSKMAKADGRISEDEVRYCEQVFDRIGLHGEKREYCIRVFRTAKNDGHSIYEYATSFADAQRSGNVRVIVYGILWDLACADGAVSPEEIQILRSITSSLRIDRGQYEWERSRRGVPDPDAEPSPREDAYEVLGCTRASSDDDIRRAYREKAKQLHPDALRAQGLSDELLSRANEQMARINAAWSEIKRERGL